MTITLDENGICLADVAVRPFVSKHLLDRSNIHVSNLLVIDVIRAELIKVQQEDRPEIRWIFYGQEVHFDNDLRSHDAFNHPNTRISEDALSTIICNGMKKLLLN